MKQYADIIGLMSISKKKTLFFSRSKLANCDREFANVDSTLVLVAPQFINQLDVQSDILF